MNEESTNKVEEITIRVPFKRTLMELGVLLFGTAAGVYGGTHSSLSSVVDKLASMESKIAVMEEKCKSTRELLIQQDERIHYLERKTK